MITVRVIKEFSSTIYGNAIVGEYIHNLQPGQARHLINIGRAEFVSEVKKKEIPEAELIPLSQVGQVLPAMTLSMSGENAPLLPSTTAACSPDGATLSTQVTAHGGMNTTTSDPVKPKRGRKPKMRPESTD